MYSRSTFYLDSFKRYTKKEKPITSYLSSVAILMRNNGSLLSSQTSVVAAPVNTLITFVLVVIIVVAPSSSMVDGRTLSSTSSGSSSFTFSREMTVTTSLDITRSPPTQSKSLNSVSDEITSTRTASVTQTETLSLTISKSVTPTRPTSTLYFETPTATFKSTKTISQTKTVPTFTNEVTISVSKTGTGIMSVSDSSTDSIQIPRESFSMTFTDTVSESPGKTVTRNSMSSSRSMSPHSSSLEPSLSRSPSESQQPSMSRSASPSRSVSEVKSITDSPTVSMTPWNSLSKSYTVTLGITPRSNTTSQTTSDDGSLTKSLSWSKATKTIAHFTPTQTVSHPQSESKSGTMSLNVTTSKGSLSISWSDSPTQSFSYSMSTSVSAQKSKSRLTFSPPGSSSTTPSLTMTKKTPSKDLSLSSSHSDSLSMSTTRSTSGSKSNTNTVTSSLTETFSLTEAGSTTDSTTISRSKSGLSPTQSYSSRRTRSVASLSMTSSESVSPHRSKSYKSETITFSVTRIRRGVSATPMDSKSKRSVSASPTNMASLTRTPSVTRTQTSTASLTASKITLQISMTTSDTISIRTFSREVTSSGTRKTPSRTRSASREPFSVSHSMSRSPTPSLSISQGFVSFSNTSSSSFSISHQHSRSLASVTSSSTFSLVISSTQMLNKTHSGSISLQGSATHSMSSPKSRTPSGTPSITFTTTQSASTTPTVLLPITHTTSSTVTTSHSQSKERSPSKTTSSTQSVSPSNTKKSRSSMKSLSASKLTPSKSPSAAHTKSPSPSRSGSTDPSVSKTRDSQSGSRSESADRHSKSKTVSFSRTASITQQVRTSTITIRLSPSNTSTFTSTASYSQALSFSRSRSRSRDSSTRSASFSISISQLWSTSLSGSQEPSQTRTSSRRRSFSRVVSVTKSKNTPSTTDTPSASTTVSSRWSLSKSFSLSRTKSAASVPQSQTRTVNSPSHSVTDDGSTSVTLLDTRTRTMVFSPSTSQSSSVSQQQKSRSTSSSASFSQAARSQSRSTTPTYSESPSLSNLLTSMTITRTLPRTRSLSPSQSLSARRSNSRSQTYGTVSKDRSRSPSGTPTSSITGSFSKSFSTDMSLTKTVLIPLTRTLSMSPSRSVTQQPSFSDSPTNGTTITNLLTLEISVTTTPSDTSMVSVTRSPSRTSSPSFTTLISFTRNRRTHSSSIRVSLSHSAVPTLSLRLAPTATQVDTVTRIRRRFSKTASFSSSQTITEVETYSETISRSVSQAQASASRSSSFSQSSTFSPTATRIIPATVTQRITPSKTITKEESISRSPSLFPASNTRSYSQTLTLVLTLTPALLATHTIVDSRTTTGSVSLALSKSKTMTRPRKTVTSLFSVSPSSSASFSAPFASRSSTTSLSRSTSQMKSITSTRTISPQRSVTSSENVTDTWTISGSDSPSPSHSLTPSSVRSRTKSAPTQSSSPSVSFSLSASISQDFGSKSRTVTVTISVTVPLTITPRITSTISTTSSANATSRSSSVNTMTMQESMTKTLSRSASQQNSVSHSMSPRSGSEMQSMSNTSSLTLSGSISQQITETETMTVSISGTVTLIPTDTNTITPPPTPTHSISVSPVLSKTESQTQTISLLTTITVPLSRSYSESPSVSPSQSANITRTQSISQMPMSDTQSVSYTVTNTNMTTFSGSQSSDGTKTRSRHVSGTKSLGMSSSRSLRETFTKTLRQTTTHTMLITATTFITKTISTSLSGSTSQTVSSTQTSTVTEGDSKSKTLSSTSTFDFISPNAFFTTVPHTTTYQFLANRILMFRFDGIPLNVSGDQVVLIHAQDSCSDAAALAVANDVVTFRSQSRSAAVHNWTAVPRTSGSMTICYYSTTKRMWQAIVKPVPNIQLFATMPHPLLEIVTMVSNTVIVAQYTATVYGVNISFDQTYLVRFGQSCTGTTSNPFSGSVSSYDFRSNLVTLRFSGVPAAGDYSICYIGFPHVASRVMLLSGTRRIRIVGAIAKSSPISQPSNYKVGRMVAYEMSGYGLSVRDAYFLTNASAARPGVSPCSMPFSTAGSVRISWGQIERVKTASADPNNLQTVIVDFVLSIPYNLTMCYRSNFSSGFTFVQFLDYAVAPILPTSRAPLVSSSSGLAPSHWAVGGDLYQTFSGEGIDTSYDSVVLQVNTTSCNTGSSLSTLVMSPLSVTRSPGVASFVYRRIPSFQIPQNGTIMATVCYKSNFSLWLNMGTVQLDAVFWNASDAAALRTFNVGSRIQQQLSIAISSEAVSPGNSSNLLYLLDKPSTASTSSVVCRSVAPLNAILPIATNASHATFNVGGWGTRILCAVSGATSTIQNASFVVLPTGPTSITPRTIAVLVPTVVSIDGGVNFMDPVVPDTLFPCNASLSRNMTITPASVNTANITTEILGNISMCVRYGLRPTIVVTVGNLSASPMAYLDAITPAGLVIGSVASVTIMGYSLQSQDRLFACDSSSGLILTRVSLNCVGTRNNTRDQATICLVEWAVNATFAGSFALCYSFAVAVSFPPLSLGNISFDAIAVSFSPTEIYADATTNLSLTGVAMDGGISELFVRTSAAGCDQSHHPIDAVYLTATSFIDVTTNDTQWQVLVPGVRGSLSLCYRSYSLFTYSLGRITVRGRVSQFATSQVTVVTSQRYSGYPIRVDLVGAAILPTADVFFLVLASYGTCNVSATTTKVFLSTSTTPIAAFVATLTLTVIVPDAGTYTLCYSMGNSTPTAVVSPPPLSSVLVVTSSLVVNATSIGLVGPASTAAPRYGFLFSVAKQRGSVLTPFASQTNASTISVRYMPLGSAVLFSAQLIATNGVVVLSINASIDVTLSSITLCTSFPQTLVQLDTTYQFALSFIALYNFNATDCYSKIPSDYSAGPSLLLTEVSNLIAADVSLVKDAVTTYDLFTTISINTPMSSTSSATLMATVLSASAQSLNVPISQITSELLAGHITMVDNVFAYAVESISNTSASSSSAVSVPQSVVLTAVNRLVLVAQKYCDSGIAGNTVETAASASESSYSFTALRIPAATDHILINQTGANVSTDTSVADPTSQINCFLMFTAPKNFIPSPTTAAARARTFQVQDINPIVLSDFNIPLLSVSLPSSTAANPLSALKTVSFTIPHAPVPRDPRLPDLGVGATLDLYRFYPDTSRGTSGAWALDTSGAATFSADNNSLYITYDITTTAASSQPTLFLSGSYTVFANTPPIPTKQREYYLVYYMGGLVVAHLLAVAIGYLCDQKRDGRMMGGHIRPPTDSSSSTVAMAIDVNGEQRSENVHEPTTTQSTIKDTTTAAEATEVWHWLLVVFYRAPHHVFTTANRVTSFLTLMFSISLFAMVELESVSMSHSIEWNVLYGLCTAVIAIPFATPSRTALSCKTRDIPSWATSVASMIAVVITLFVATPSIAAIPCAIVAVICFPLVWLIFYRKSTVKALVERSRIAVLLGYLFHIVVESACIAYVVYRAMTGVPIAWGVHYDYFIVVGVALAFVLLIIDPVTNVFKAKLVHFAATRAAAAEERHNKKQLLRKASARIFDEAQHPPFAGDDEGTSHGQEEVDDEASSELLEEESPFGHAIGHETDTEHERSQRSRTRQETLEGKKGLRLPPPTASRRSFRVEYDGDYFDSAEKRDLKLYRAGDDEGSSTQPTTGSSFRGLRSTATTAASTTSRAKPTHLVEPISLEEVDVGSAFNNNDFDFTGVASSEEDEDTITLRDKAPLPANSRPFLSFQQEDTSPATRPRVSSRLSHISMLSPSVIDNNFDSVDSQDDTESSSTATESNEADIVTESSEESASSSNETEDSDYLDQRNSALRTR